MSKPLSPEIVREKAKKMIICGEKNVDLIIDCINNILITESATILCGTPIKIHRDDLVRPNPNWQKQTFEAVESALKAFKKEWSIKRNGKWENNSCNVEFSPKAGIIDNMD